MPPEVNLLAEANRLLTEYWRLLTVGAGVITGAVWVALWFRDVNNDRKSFKEFMGKVEEQMGKIEKQIGKMFERLPRPRTIASDSPLRLTEMGEEIAARLNASEVIEKCIAEDVLGPVAGKTSLKIQEMSFAYFRETFVPSDDLEKIIEACAFDNGISREDVLDVLAIELRDALLRQVGGSE